MVTRNRQATDRQQDKQGVQLTMARVTRTLAAGQPLLGEEAIALWKQRLRALCSSLDIVEEPRDVRGRRHPLTTVLAIAVLGSMCGADSADSMHLWALRQRPWLEEFVDFPCGVPSQDTILRVLAAIDPRGLRTAFREWVKMVLGPKVAHGMQVSIDGKTLRGSGGGRGHDNPTHMVTAIVSEMNLVIGQRACADKSNEITAIPKLLELLSIRGALVSIDAMGCQVEIAQKIRSKQADYLLALKGNQGLLHEQIKVLFAEIHSPEPRSADAARPPDAATAVSVDAGHGRAEERTAWVVQRSSDPKAFERWLPDSKRWPDIAAVICVREQRENLKTGKVSTECRYFITSRAMSPDEALRGVRGHWAIENGLHWILDVCFGEDQSRVRTENAAENLAVVRHLAHGLLRRHTADTVSVAKRRELCLMWPHYLEFVLGSASEAAA